MYKFTKKEILDVMKNKEEVETAIRYIFQKLNICKANVDAATLVQLRRYIISLKRRSLEKYHAANRMRTRYESVNAKWLVSEFKVPDKVFEITPSSSFPTPNYGRPHLPFKEKSERSKRREAAVISDQNQNDPQKILMACCYAARRSGDNNLRIVLKESSESAIKVAKIKSLIKNPAPIIKKLTVDEALQYLLDRGLSKDDYISLRLLVKSRGADIFPAYKHISAAKMKCRPSEQDVTITDTMAEVSVQSLLNHTAQRIVEYQTDVIVQYLNENHIKEVETVMICSWGFDGSSGHSVYKQKFGTGSADISDENLFATTLIPLRLLTGNNTVLWNNRSSQSTRFCRPIKLEFVKESAKVILNHKEAIENQIATLQILKIKLQDYTVSVHFSLHLTLIDGKVLNIITGTRSMQTCPICHATPRQFNELTNISTANTTFLSHPNSLQHGISPLHAWIRFLECLLHISYRLHIKKWQVRGADKKEVIQRKREVQAILWEKMGLKVDQPKPGGSGTTNDGNTARRAFKEPHVLAELLGLHFPLIHNMQIILIALSVHLPINATLFGSLCNATAKLYVEHYQWYPMPSSVHKVLIHGADIIKNSILPTGMLGEEASEGRNKNYKQYRLHHSRKHNRAATIEDTFYRVMDSSDPIISSLNIQSSLRKSSKRKNLPLPVEVQNLLAVSELEKSHSSDDDDDSDEHESENVTGLLETFEVLDNIELFNENDNECSNSKNEEM